MSGEVELEYEVKRLDSKGLDIFYRVLNASERSIHLLAPLTEMGDEGPEPMPNKVYVFLDDEGVVQITKRLWPVPEDVEVYQPEVPCLTEVPAGHYFEELVSLPVPLKVAHPYRVEDGEQGEMVDARGVAVSIGYVVQDAGSGEGGGDSIGYGAVNQCQTILRGQPLNTSVLIQKDKG